MIELHTNKEIKIFDEDLIIDVFIHITQSSITGKFKSDNIIKKQITKDLSLQDILSKISGDVVKIEIDITEEEFLNLELKTLQNEYTSVSRRKHNLKEYIKNIIKKLEKFESVLETDRDRVKKLITRDIDLIKDLIIKTGKPVSSKQIILYLNETLVDKPTRWKDKLDSNLFMSIMGRHLEKYGFHKEPGHYESRKTYYWYIV